MKTFLIYSLSVVVLLISACNKEKIPGVYRIDIQQGNEVTQDMVNKLQPGMTKSQVAFILGTPLLIDTFHPNRWDYIYSFHPGNGKREQRRLTIFFDDEQKLSHVEGDTRTVAREDLPVNDRSDTNVVVPLSEKKTGIFQGLMNSIGLGDDDEQEIQPSETSETETSETETSETETSEPENSASPEVKEQN